MTTRRDFVQRLTATAACIGAAAPAEADTPDPIFALIEQHKAAERAYGDRLTARDKLEVELPDELQQSNIDVGGANIVETDDPRWIAAEQAAWDACQEADRLATAFFEARPTTFAGLVARLRYAGQCVDDGSEWPSGFLLDDTAEAIEELMQTA